MGGGERFDYPKYVWSPAGGWWCNPTHWKRNTVLLTGGVLLSCIPIFYLSAGLERRPQPPINGPIFSQRFATHAAEDDPSLAAKQ
eukprot:m.224825 g.224825  ORF g.224825 m.224825 type:complete len:85 (-) comp16550_c0_seq1:78-332(-)